MIKGLWDLAKEIMSLSQAISSKKEARNKKLADLLEHIGVTVQDTFNKLSQGQYPGGNCEQLRVFSEELYTHLDPVLGSQRALELSSKLDRVHEVELLFSDLQSGRIDKSELNYLEEASGHFIASAKLLRF